MKSITYTSNPDNSQDVYNFIGKQPKCPVCDGYGEYETGYGPQGCMPCNSRLIFFIDYAGNRRGADWGDIIEKSEIGLELFEGNMDYEK